jgi:cytochrome b involved in lipid metabolism
MACGEVLKMKFQIFLFSLFLLFVVACTPQVENQDDIVSDNIESDTDVLSNTENSVNQESEEGSDSIPTDSVQTYTLSELAEHNTADDCWMAINGKVYDVTEYTSRHPGGAAIEEGCGIDSTQLYETRPMGSGTPHSSGARQRLEQYYIGDLEDA